MYDCFEQSFTGGLNHMAYQIFISYRRDGSEFLGKILYDRLTAAGYTAFYDVESLNSGEFNEQLYEQIDHCTDFLLLLPPHALDRCLTDPEDWVLKEISRAISKKKNIVPIIMRGFGDFPANLPASIASLPIYQRLDATLQEYFDAAFERLCTQYLVSRPAVSGPDPSPYPPTTDTRMTDIMLQLIQYLRKNGLEYSHFYDLCQLTEARIVSGTFDEWEKLERAYGSKDPYLETRISHMKKLTEWITSLPEHEQAQIRQFHQEVKSLRYIYNGDGTLYRNPSFQHMAYQSSTWDILDIFGPGSTRWIIAAKKGPGLLPEIGVFQASGNSVVQMIPNSQDYVMALIYYTVSIRLMELFPRYVREKLGEENIRELAQTLNRQNPGVESDWMLYNDHFNNTSVSGNYVRRGWFFSTTSYVSINKHYSYTIDPKTRQELNTTPFGKQQALDIVQIREYDEDSPYMVLTCPLRNKGDTYYKDEPHVYRVEAHWTDILGGRQLEYKELLPDNTTVVEPGVLERFALRMAVYRMMKVIG